MKTGQFSGFTVEVDADGIAVVTFDQPDRLNAMNRATKRDLIETALQAQMDDRVRVIVFTGQGKAFIAGDDLDRARQFDTEPVLVDPLPYGPPSSIRTYESLRSCSQLLNVTLNAMDKLSIAAVNGFAIQSGLSLALTCDFRIASRSARLGSATLRYGYLPDEGGHWLLTQTLGQAGALDFILRKRIVDADEAFRLGLVTEVVEPDELMGRTMELARELADGPQVAMRLAKKAIRNAATMTFEQALDDIASKTAIGDHHPDAHEGRASFRERRPPRFNAWLADLEQQP